MVSLCPECSLWIACSQDLERFTITAESKYVDCPTMSDIAVLLG